MPAPAPPPTARFAGSRPAAAGARFAVGGLAWDAASPHRRGAAEGPAAVRRASHALAPWSLRSGVDAASLELHDLGDAPVKPDAPADEAVKVLGQFWEGPVQKGMVPVLLGGSRAGSPALAAVLARRHPELRVLHLAAHFGWRDADGGSSNAHTCTARRLADAVGAKRLGVLGVRSADRDALDHARRAGAALRTSFEVQRVGISRAADDVLRAIGPGPLHISLDIAALDPAHAPGTGAPEPYGLAPLDVLAVVQRCAGRIVGLDVTEVSPPHDGGKTPALAARLVRDALDEVTLAA